MAVDSNALSQSWTGLSLFAFPPIPLLERTLIKIREDQVEVIVIAPSWPRRSWYHLLLQMVCKIPLRQPLQLQLWGGSVTTPADKGVLYHTDLAILQLTTWKLSGVPSSTRAFLMQLSE